MARISFIVAAVALATFAVAADAPYTALVDCHLHGSTQYCIAEPSGAEIAVRTITSESSLPTSYDDCHTHNGATFCIDPKGSEVLMESADDSHSEHDDHDDHEHESDESSAPVSKENCHFHAGVEHCTGGNHSGATTCAKVDRDYNIPLRIGAIFIVLVTSAISVFIPLLLRRFTKSSMSSIFFMIIKQFGTGVIIATAYVHLLTHAQMMFNNECIGVLEYEGTASAIAMAGIFLAFMIDWSAHRFMTSRQDHAATSSHSSNTALEEGAPEKSEGETHGNPSMGMPHNLGCHDVGKTEDKVSVAVMEAGIIFHSILIGITLVVAGDSAFGTLLVVIIFHQAFEGLALGTRISGLAPITSLTKTKLALAGLFSAITPIGMSIGLGVMTRFNGNDKATLIAMGTLDALSAGILVWVGVAEMLCHDWLYGDLKRASALKSVVGMVSLVLGMILMSVLGKWA